MLTNSIHYEEKGGGFEREMNKRISNDKIVICQIRWRKGYR